MKTFYSLINRNLLRLLQKGLMLTASLFVVQQGFAQLSGSYTIDKTKAASTTNYQSFKDLFTDLSAATRSDGGTTNGPGVSAAIQIDVAKASGPYTEQVLANAISGVSAKNTITINGNGETLQFNGTTASNHYTFRFNGADYVTIDGLDIAALGITYGKGIEFMNNSNNNTIQNCTVRMPNLTGTSANNAYLAFTGSTSAATTRSTNGYNCTIRNNRFFSGSSSVGPYYAITVNSNEGTSTTGSTGIVISGNDIRDFYYYGLYTQYVSNCQFTNNHIHSNRTSTTTLYGVRNYYLYKCEFTDNKISDLSTSGTMYALYQYYNDYTNIERNEIFDISTAGAVYGMYGYYNDYSSISFNDIHDIKGTSTGYIYGIHAYYHLYTDINYNKIHHLDGAGYIYGFYSYYTDNSHFDNNELFWFETDRYIYGHYSYYNDYTSWNNNIVRDMHPKYTTSTSYVYGIYSYYWLYGEQMNNEYRDWTSDNYGGYYHYAQYTYYCDYVRFVNNEVTNLEPYYYVYGQYMGYCDNSEVSKLRVHDLKCNYLYGIYSTQCYYLESYNNAIYNCEVLYYIYGFYHYYAYYLEHHNNTTVFNRPVTNGYYHLMLYYANDQKIYNNLYYDSLDGGTNCFFTYVYNPVNAEFKTNNYFNLRGSHPIMRYYNGSATTDYQDLSGWKKDIEPTSMGVNPMFAAQDGFYHSPASFEMANKGTPTGLTEDILGKKRNLNNPDIGCRTYTIDIGISNFNLKNGSYCGGKEEIVSVDVTNKFELPVTNIPISIDNEVNKFTEVIEETILPGQTITYTLKRPAKFVGGSSTISRKITLKLEAGDDSSYNDVVSQSASVVPSPFGANFTEGSYYPGYYNLGDQGQPDVTIPGEEVEYEFTAPFGKTNSSYGNVTTGWVATPYIMTPNGLMQNTGATIVPPNGSVNGKLQFDPDPSLYDSIVWVGVKIEDASCDSVIGRYMFVPPMPAPSFDLQDACNGDIVETTNTSSIDPDHIAAAVWEFNDSDPNVIDTSEIYDGFHTYSTYGTYNVTLKAYNYYYPKFKKTLTKQVVVRPTADVDFALKNACEGVDIEFSNKSTVSGTGAMIHNWNFGDGSNINNSTNPSYEYANPGTYTVTLSVDYQGCKASKSKFATQFDRPTADFDHNGFCSGQDVQFLSQAQIVIGRAGSIWDFTEGGNSYISNPKHVFKNAGNYNVKFTTISEFGCRDSITKTIEISPSPEVDFAYSEPCNGSDMTFAFTGQTNDQGTSGFFWNVNNEASSNNTQVNHYFEQIGRKFVTLRVENTNGCISNLTQEFNVKIQPKADFAAEDICEKTEFIPVNKSTVSGGNMEFSWRMGDGSEYDVSNPVHIFTVDQSKTYDVTLIASSPGGCNDTMVKSIQVVAAPTTTFSPNKSGKEVSPVLDDMNTADYTFMQWRFGDGSTSTETSPTHSYATGAGTFTICFTATNKQGCTDQSCENVTINLSDIKKLENKGLLSVYPNPNNGNFKVKVEQPENGLKIRVVSITGQLISEIQGSELQSEYNIQLDKAAAGTYIVFVQNGAQLMAERITLSK